MLRPIVETQAIDVIDESLCWGVFGNNQRMVFDFHVIVT